MLVTDAVPALGLPDGKYHMGADQIIVEGKRATIAGTETLCGSIASMAECVQNMRQALLDGETKKTSQEKIGTKFIVESIDAATLHPAAGKFRARRFDGSQSSRTKAVTLPRKLARRRWTTIDAIGKQSNAERKSHCRQVTVLQVRFAF